MNHQSLGSISQKQVGDALFELCRRKKGCINDIIRFFSDGAQNLTFQLNRLFQRTQVVLCQRMFPARLLKTVDEHKIVCIQE